MLDRILTVRVDRVMRQTPEVVSLELVHPTGRPLPAYEAGAHIDVHLPGGFTRSYSLARAPQGDASGGGETRYVIGVKREAEGRGGSAAFHDRVRPGDRLAIGSPRSALALAPQAAHHLLLAGLISLLIRLLILLFGLLPLSIIKLLHPHFPFQMIIPYFLGLKKQVFHDGSG